MGEKGDPSVQEGLMTVSPSGVGAYYRRFPERFRDRPVGPTRQVLEDGHTAEDVIVEDANGDWWEPGPLGQWVVRSTLKSRDPHTWLSLDPSHVREWNDENPDAPMRYEDYGFPAP